MDVAGFRSRCTLLALRLLFLVAIAGFVGCSMLGPTTASSFLNKIETSKDPNERYKAYEKLSSDRAYDNAEQRARAVKLLVAALDGNKEPVATRAIICRTLATLGDPSARESMLRLSRDPDTLVRTEAVRCLGKVGKPEDATVLMQTMTLDDNPDCKVAAIEALGTMKSVDPRTPSYLVEGMANDDAAIRLASYRSLKLITGKDVGVEVKAWREYLAKLDSSDKKAASDLPPLPPAERPRAGRRQAVQSPTLDASAKPASSVLR